MYGNGKKSAYRENGDGKPGETPRGGEKPQKGGRSDIWLWIGGAVVCLGVFEGVYLISPKFTDGNWHLPALGLAALAAAAAAILYALAVFLLRRRRKR